eukprot:TRINITY_DN30933_c0_g1_i1.p1 TRINITY_DN30933_c0_g1~~TRINITY_DN30933_c0_g1_i1.p1  ORF type:complete len:101 (-),score=4.80 TRINITY_DN30933_c0_g1_i1:249-551(-)
MCIRDRRDAAVSRTSRTCQVRVPPKSQSGIADIHRAGMMVITVLCSHQANLHCSSHTPRGHGARHLPLSGHWPHRSPPSSGVRRVSPVQGWVPCSRCAWA